MPRVDRLSSQAVKLLKERQIAHFVTLMPDGDPQVTPVWVDVEDDGSHVLINTADGRVKDRNVERDARVAVSVADGENFERAVSIRGRIVERRKEGAIDNIHELSRKYRGRDYTFRSEAEAQARVIFRIKPYAVVERNLGS